MPTGKPLIQLKQDLERIGKNIEKEANSIKRRTARETLKKLLWYSPVHTGDYIKSHRVGISKTAAGRGVGIGAHPVTPFKAFIDKPSASEAKMMKEAEYQKKKGYISTAQPKDTIVISNNIHYADRVEFIGWSSLTEGRGTPPYYVYSLTIQDMNIKFPLIVKTSKGVVKNVGKAGWWYEPN